MAWSSPTEWERWDPDKVLICPYDQMHRIPAKRYQYHIIKCREKHPEKDFVSCPFNAKHIMLRTDLRRHITRCPDKGEIEPYSFKGSEKDSEGFYFKGDTSVPCYRKEECSIPPDDDWDIEDDGTTTHQNLCEYYRGFAAGKNISTSPSNNQTVQNVLSLQPTERDEFKNRLRSKAVQNHLARPPSGLNCYHGNMAKSNIDNTPRNILQQHTTNGQYRTMLDGSQYNHSTRPLSSVEHLLDSSTHVPQTFRGAGSQYNHSTRPLSSVEHLLDSSTHVPQTFRGAGRARLAEEARRTQFGITSCTGLQNAGCSAGRGRGMLSFYTLDDKI